MAGRCAADVPARRRLAARAAARSAPRNVALPRWRIWRRPAAGPAASKGCCRMPCGSSTASPGRLRACPASRYAVSHGRCIAAGDRLGRRREGGRHDPARTGADRGSRAEHLDLRHARGGLDARAARCLRAGGTGCADRAAARRHDQRGARLAGRTGGGRRPGGAVAIRLARGERVPAFGHPLYPGWRSAGRCAAVPPATARHARQQLVEAMRT